MQYDLKIKIKNNILKNKLNIERGIKTCKTIT